MTDDLVGRLRAFCDHHGFGDGSSPALAAARIEALEAALRPFALDLKDHVPDDQLIDTVAWTAGEHRAAKAALTPEPPHAD